MLGAGRCRLWWNNRRWLRCNGRFRLRLGLRLGFNRGLRGIGAAALLFRGAGADELHFDHVLAALCIRVRRQREPRVHQPRQGQYQREMQKERQRARRQAQAAFIASRRLPAPQHDRREPPPLARLHSRRESACGNEGDKFLGPARVGGADAPGGAFQPRLPSSGQPFATLLRANGAELPLPQGLDEFRRGQHPRRPLSPNCA